VVVFDRRRDRGVVCVFSISETGGSARGSMCVYSQNFLCKLSGMSTVQGVAVCCSVLQYVAGILSLIQWAKHRNVCCSVLQCVAVCCSVLQCVVVNCFVLQYVTGVPLQA